MRKRRRRIHTASDAGSEAVAPPPSTAFNNLTAALEGQGLVVTRTPKASLDGAEAGVDIKGDKSGQARSFAAASEAKDYAKEASNAGDKTTIVGTVAFRAGTQADADFFAQAYEVEPRPHAVDVRLRRECDPMVTRCTRGCRQCPRNSRSPLSPCRKCFSLEGVGIRCAGDRSAQSTPHARSSVSESGPVT